MRPYFEACAIPPEINDHGKDSIKITDHDIPQHSKANVQPFHWAPEQVVDQYGAPEITPTIPNPLKFYEGRVLSVNPYERGIIDSDFITFLEATVSDEPCNDYIYSFPMTVEMIKYIKELPNAEKDIFKEAKNK